jgi:hypothetical protein
LNLFQENTWQKKGERREEKGREGEEQERERGEDKEKKGRSGSMRQACGDRQTTNRQRDRERQRPSVMNLILVWSVACES